MRFFAGFRGPTLPVTADLIASSIRFRGAKYVIDGYNGSVLLLAMEYSISPMVRSENALATMPR